jgi:dolichyl-diphosphooligosaccharide--protein glycosyltransferase
MSNVTQAAAMAESMSEGRPTYVAIFITGAVFPLTSSTGSSTPYYILQVPTGSGLTAGGGDESKKQWFIRIGNFTESKYLECPSASDLTSAGQPCTSLTASGGVDDFNLTPYAIKNTLFGQLLPFQLAGYLYTSGSGSSTTIQFSTTYTPGSSGAPPIEAFTYPSSYNFPANSTGPFRLAYVSPSLAAAEAGNSPCAGDSALQCFNTILLYQLVS